MRDIEKLSDAQVDCIEACCQRHNGIGAAVQGRHGRCVRIGIFQDDPANDCYHCDVSTREGYERGLALIKKLKPRWLWCAPPRTAHCGLQMLNAYKSEENWNRFQIAKRHCCRNLRSVKRQRKTPLYHHQFQRKSVGWFLRRGASRSGCKPHGSKLASAQGHGHRASRGCVDRVPTGR